MGQENATKKQPTLVPLTRDSSDAARHAKTSAAKKKNTSKLKRTKEVSVRKEVIVRVAAAAVATYNNSNDGWDYDNVPSAAQAAKQADIEAGRASFNAKDYAVEEDLSWQAEVCSKKEENFQGLLLLQ